MSVPHPKADELSTPSAKVTIEQMEEALEERIVPDRRHEPASIDNERRTNIPRRESDRADNT